MKMEEHEYRLSFWAIVIIILTVVSDLIEPFPVDRIGIALLLLFLARTLPKKWENLVIPAIISSGLYWISTFFSGALAFVLSLFGFVFAIIIVIDLIEIAERRRKKKIENSG